VQDFDPAWNSYVLLPLIFGIHVQMIALKSKRFAGPRPVLANQWVVHQYGVWRAQLQIAENRPVQDQILRVLLKCEFYTTPTGK
jgi:hypothetical protein